MPTLYPYQEEGVAFLRKHPRALLADQMGLGKTAQIINAINYLPTDAKTIILCPASLKLNWEREAHMWLNSKRRITPILSTRSNIPTDPGITIINYDIIFLPNLFKAIMKQDWDAMVLDEVHYCKNRETKRTLAALGGFDKKKRKWVAGIAQKSQRIWALSGTPVPNRPKELYPLCSTLWPNIFKGGYWDFAKRYANAHTTKWGWDDNGASNLDELNAKLRKAGMLRRLKADVLTDLPDKVRQIIVIPPNTKTLKEALRSEAPYAQAVAEWLDGGPAVAFEDMSLIRKQVALAKTPLVVDHLVDLLDGGLDKVVVFAHHKEVVAELCTQLKAYNPVSIIGDTSNKQRQINVDRFQQEPSVRVFVGNIQAAGVGLTLTAASHVVMAELDWVPGNVTQAEDRCHRIGQKDTVNVQHVVVQGSIDERLVQAIVEKQKIQDQILDPCDSVYEDPLLG